MKTISSAGSNLFSSTNELFNLRYDNDLHHNFFYFVPLIYDGLLKEASKILPKRYFSPE